VLSYAIFRLYEPDIHNCIAQAPLNFIASSQSNIIGCINYIVDIALLVNTHTNGYGLVWYIENSRFYLLIDL
jgi:hypothetical protein